MVHLDVVAVAVDVRVTDLVDVIATRIDAGSRAAAVAVDSVVLTDCEDVLGCRLRDWHGCCVRKSCPSLRGPSMAQIFSLVRMLFLLLENSNNVDPSTRTLRHFTLTSF